MGIISRRKFINRSLLGTPGILLFNEAKKISGPQFFKDRTQDKIKAFIPMPLQVVIDDVGWWSGEDGSKRQEPYRTGINRNHVPADYLAIVELGRALGIRPQAAMILCEWDRENILRHLPTSTWMGEKWDNSKWVGPWMEEAAEIISSNREHFELTIHGVGHEYWENGIFTRAEWTDSRGRMRPRDQVERHLDYYSKILEQNKLGPFPESFVPAAFRHCFGKSDGREVSLAGILEKRGVNYINTPFRIMFNNSVAGNKLFGFDSGVLTIDRGEDEFEWDVFPADPEMIQTGPTYGMHWPNMLHPDPGKNIEVVGRWINYFRQYNEIPDRILAADSVDLQHQLLHRQLTRFASENNSIRFDFSETDKLPGTIGKKGLTVRIQSDRPMAFKGDNLKISSESSVKKESFLYTLKVERKEGQKEARIDCRPKIRDK